MSPFDPFSSPGFENFQILEQQQVGAKPIECFRFQVGDDATRYTSADMAITLLDGEYMPETISRQDIEYNDESGSGSVTIFVPRTHPIVPFVIAPTIGAPIAVRVRRAFRGAEGSAEELFRGRVTGARVSGSQVSLLCTSAIYSLDRRLPAMSYQRQCNNVLGSGRCPVDLDGMTDTITVETADGRELTSSDFANRPDGWFTAGRLFLEDHSIITITSHSGDTVRLLYAPKVAPEIGSVITAQPGCDRLPLTCRGKFGAQISRLGFSFVPDINPLKASRRTTDRGYYGYRG